MAFRRNWAKETPIASSLKPDGSVVLVSAYRDIRTGDPVKIESAEGMSASHFVQFPLFYHIHPPQPGTTDALADAYNLRQQTPLWEL